MADWKKTEEPGIYRHTKDPGKFRIHATATEPDSGKVKHRRRTIEDATMLQATMIREELKAEIRRPKDSTREQLLVDFAGQWVRERIDAGHWGERTAGTNMQILEDHILPQIGHIPVGELDRQTIRRWIDYAENSRREITGEDGKRELVPYANASLRRWWRVVKQLVRALYLEGYFDARMIEWCREVKGPTSNVALRREMETMTREELNRYLAKAKELAPDRYAEIVTLACTGMRAGELYGLEWRHVDYDAHTIRIEQSYLAPRNNRAGRIKSTKTGKARLVPIVPMLASALEAHRKRLMREQNPGLREGIVFPSNTGERRFASCLHKPMQQIAEACGIDIKVGPQVMRRTFVTLMGNVGVRREMIKAISGHATNEMHDHYTHIRPEDRRAAVTQLFGEGIG